MQPWLLLLAFVLLAAAILCIVIASLGGIEGKPTVLGAALQTTDDMAPLEIKRRRGREGIRKKFAGQGNNYIRQDKVTIEHPVLDNPVHCNLKRGEDVSTGHGNKVYVVVTEYQNQVTVIPTQRLLTDLVQERGVSTLDISLWGRSLHPHLSAMARDMGIVAREVPGVLHPGTFALLHGEGQRIIVLGKGATLQDYDAMRKQETSTIHVTGSGLDMQDDDWWAALNVEMPLKYDKPFLWRAAHLDRKALYNTVLLAHALDKHPSVAAGDDALWAASVILGQPLNVV